jgi:hypothetical protein
MYSRRGKSTINHYLCFSRDEEEIILRKIKEQDDENLDTLDSISQDLPKSKTF